MEETGGCPVKRAFFAKDQAARSAFAARCVSQHKGVLFYLCPKRRIKECPIIHPHQMTIAYEDLTKTSIWLKVNSLVGADAALVLDSPSRYPKITSEKVLYLQRLSMQMQIEKKVIVDLVPFTKDVQYLYTPFSYLNRNILGYPHYYAFRENYDEEYEGLHVRAHDHDVLAKKISRVAEINYPWFLCRERHLVECPVTPSEAEAYERKKENLFSTEKSGPRIVTALADFVHAFESRGRALLQYLQGMSGEIRVFTNLASYATRLRGLLRNFGNIRVCSYEMHRGSLDGVAHLVYFESPIQKSYLLLDLEALAEDECTVHHFRGNTKVDRYLYDEWKKEAEQIDAFCRTFWSVTHGWKEAVSSQECL